MDPRNRSAERDGELQTLANFLEGTYGHIYAKGIGYLRRLAGPTTARGPPKLHLLERGQPCDLSLLSSFERPIDDAFVPHKLQVHFKQPRRTVN